MILEFEDHKIVTDDKQFIVQKKKVVQEGRFTKAENVGKEYWEDAAYCSTLDFALNYVAKSVLLNNDDVAVIKEKLDKLEEKINEFVMALRIRRRNM